MSIYKGTQLISGVATPVEAGRNIGQIIQSLLPITDAGLHLLDGTLIDGNGIYSAFVNYIKGLDLTASYFTTEADWQASVTQYGVCGKFVYDSVANTVRLPKVTGILEGTINASALGDLVEAGLPNIEGEYSGRIYTTTAFGGDMAPFKTAGNASYEASNKGSGSCNSIVGFDASLSNPTYGNSTTVQPQTIKGYYYIVIATGTKTDIEVDIDNIVTDLNTLIPNSSDIIAGYAMPSGTYTNLTLGASASTYTAPANGWFFINLAGGNSQYARFQNSENGMAYQYGNNNTNTCSGCIEVKKGDVISVQYNGTNSTKTFRFIYAEGEV